MSEQIVYTLVAIFATIAMALGYALAYIRSRHRIDDLKQKYAELNARFDQERSATNRKLSDVEKVRSGIEQTISNLTPEQGDGMEQNLATQGDHVKALMKPLQKALQQTDNHVRNMQQACDTSHQRLHEQLQFLRDPQRRGQANPLAASCALLDAGNARHWAAETLKQQLELTGLLEHCKRCEGIREDESEEHRADRRPPALLSTADGTLIAIDPNTPLEAYLNLCMTDDEGVRAWHIESHARKLGEQIRDMASRAYRGQFDEEPDLIVLLIPDDHYLATAVELDPGLLDECARNAIALLTPRDLTTLLQIVALDWREQAFARNATRIRDTGLAMYKRFGVFAQLLAQLGSELSGAVRSYNKAVTFFEDEPASKGQEEAPPPRRASSG